MYLVFRFLFVCLFVRLVYLRCIHTYTTARTRTRALEKLLGVRLGGRLCCGAQRFHVTCFVHIILNAGFICLFVLFACRFVRLFFFRVLCC